MLKPVFEEMATLKKYSCFIILLYIVFNKDDLWEEFFSSNSK